MTPKQINELISFGAVLDVKVTPVITPDGKSGVNIMDLPTFVDFIEAAKYLQRCQDEWFGDRSCLVA